MFRSGLVRVSRGVLLRSQYYITPVTADHVPQPDPPLPAPSSPPPATLTPPKEGVELEALRELAAVAESHTSSSANHPFFFVTILIVRTLSDWGLRFFTFSQHRKCNLRILPCANHCGHEVTSARCMCDMLEATGRPSYCQAQGLFRGNQQWQQVMLARLLSMML